MRLTLAREQELIDLRRRKAVKVAGNGYADLVRRRARQARAHRCHALQQQLALSEFDILKARIPKQVCVGNLKDEKNQTSALE